MEIVSTHRLQWLGWLLVIGSLLVLAEALWSPTKAVVAQHLLRSAWALTRETGIPQRPWPWADHYPVGQLTVPRLDIDQIILAGDSGAVMAFAPGENMRTREVEHAARVVTAHRDTHFRFLEHLRFDDLIELRDQQGTAQYRVVSTNVVNSTTTQIDPTQVPDGLILVTCYPFDALTAGGEKRFVVVAEPIEP